MLFGSFTTSASSPQLISKTAPSKLPSSDLETRLTPKPDDCVCKRPMRLRVKEHLDDGCPKCAKRGLVYEGVMDDRERWNQRYREGSHAGGAPHPWALECADALPRRGRALDLAGGAGALAIWLAQRGLEVTLADVSDAGLALAVERAAAAGVSLRSQRVDLTDRETWEELGDGWSLVSCTNYFQAELFPWISQALAPGGLCLFAQPSLRNLERNPRPSARFLVDPSKLDAWLGGLQILERFEGWTTSGTHELRLLARKAG